MSEAPVHSPGVGAADPRELTPRNQSLLWFYLGIARRRIWIILPVFIVVATVGIIGAFKAPRLYAGTCKVLVERQAPQVMSFDKTGQDGGGHGWDTDFYQTQRQLARSRAVLETAVAEPGIREAFQARELRAVSRGFRRWLGEIKRTALAALGASPQVPLEPWELLREDVRVSHVPETHFLLVESISGDPFDAANAANAVARSYQRYHRQRAAATLSEAFSALQIEKAKQEANLLEAEKALQDFREKAESLTVPTSKDDQPALDRLTKLNEQLTDVQLRRIELTSQLGVMRDAAKPEVATGAASEEALFALPVIKSDGSLVDGRKALADAEKDVAVMADTYGRDHPLLQAAEAKARLLRDQFKAALSEVIQAHENKLRMLQDEEREIEKQYEEQKRLAVALAKETFTYSRLEGAVSRHRRLFDAIVERMREVDISSGLIRTNVQIVEEASPPKAPMNAGRLRGMALSLVVGLFLGVGVAFLVENLDDSIKTPEDLTERLPVALLGFVPAMGREKTSDGAAQLSPRAQVTIPAPASGHPLDADCLHRGTIVLSEPASSVAEAFRSIRTSLFYSTPASQIKIVALTSCRPQEGKSTVTTNLALSVSQAGKRVLLVDGDLHRPTTHKVLGIRHQVGLSSVLVGEVEWRQALQSVQIKDGSPLANFHVLPAGRPSPSPAELLGSQKMRDLLAEWRQQFDWVFVDTPPVLFVSDASILGAVCDGVILVVRSGASTHALLARAREQLRSVNAKVIGSVLNGMVLSRVGRNYSYYQYHGYSRYAKDYHRSYYRKEAGDDEEYAPAVKG